MSRKKLNINNNTKEKNVVDIDLSQIENMAAIGLSQEEIAIVLGIKPETLTRLKHREDEINQAIIRGKAIDKKVLLDRIKTISEFGEVADKRSDDVRFRASKYLRNVLHSVNEKQEVKHEGIQVIIPQAVVPEPPESDAD